MTSGSSWPTVGYCSPIRRPIARPEERSSSRRCSQRHHRGGGGRPSPRPSSLVYHGIRTQARTTRRTLAGPDATDALALAAVVSRTVAAAVAVAVIVGVSLLGQPVFCRYPERGYPPPIRVGVGLVLATFPVALACIWAGRPRVARWLAVIGALGRSRSAPPARMPKGSPRGQRCRGSPAGFPPIGHAGGEPPVTDHEPDHRRGAADLPCDVRQPPATSSKTGRKLLLLVREDPGHDAAPVIEVLGSSQDRCAHRWTPPSHWPGAAP